MAAAALYFVTTASQAHARASLPVPRPLPVLSDLPSYRSLHTLSTSSLSSPPLSLPSYLSSCLPFIHSTLFLPLPSRLPGHRSLTPLAFHSLLCHLHSPCPHPPRRALASPSRAREASPPSPHSPYRRQSPPPSELPRFSPWAAASSATQMRWAGEGGKGSGRWRSPLRCFKS